MNEYIHELYCRKCKAISPHRRYRKNLPQSLLSEATIIVTFGHYEVRRFKCRNCNSKRIKIGKFIERNEGGKKLIIV
jgi:hypothetical protein